MGLLSALADAAGKTFDGAGELVEDGLAVFGARAHDAAADVVLEDEEACCAQGGDDCRDLGEDIDAVLVVLNHPADAADLALDPAQAGEDLGLVVGVRGVRGDRVAWCAVSLLRFDCDGCGLCGCHDSMIPPYRTPGQSVPWR